MNKVLIVEDDAIIANIYQRKLQMDGFQVQHAADGELAMEMIKGNPPAIVLLDLQLPKANGIEVLKFIRSREETKTLPVVVFTNSYLGTLVQSAWKAGANKCLTKAICTPKQVADVLKATLAGEDSVGGPPPPASAPAAGAPPPPPTFAPAAPRPPAPPASGAPSASVARPPTAAPAPTSAPRPATATASAVPRPAAAAPTTTRAKTVGGLDMGLAIAAVVIALGAVISLLLVVTGPWALK